MVFILNGIIIRCRYSITVNFIIIIIIIIIVIFLSLIPEYYITTTITNNTIINDIIITAEINGIVDIKIMSSDCDTNMIPIYFQSDDDDDDISLFCHG